MKKRLFRLTAVPSRFALIVGLAAQACSEDDATIAVDTLIADSVAPDTSADGIDSTDGEDGTDATDATDGTDGSDGSDGSDGTDGTDGIVFEPPDWFPAKGEAAGKTVGLPGLTAPARVVFDDLGIPHIYATNDADLFYVQGYVTASQRLFQMHTLRLAGSGRLAEVLGPNSLTGDVFLRTLKLRATAEKMAEKLKNDYPAEFAYVERFCAGATLYIDRIASGEIPPTSLPPEVVALGVKEPWLPVDAMTVVRLLTYDLGFGGIFNEDSILTISKEIGAAYDDTALEYLADDVFAITPPVTVPTVPLGATKPGSGFPAVVRSLSDQLKASGANRMPMSVIAKTRDALSELETIPHHKFRDTDWGSNNWVVSGAHTKSGKPIVSNDPHLGLRNPTTFYQVHLNTKEAGGTVDQSGVIFAGVPGIVLGTNGTIAWAATVHYSDVTDQYVESFSDDGKSVIFKGKEVPISVRKEVFTFTKGDPECKDYAKGWVAGMTFETALADGKCTLTIDIEDVPHHGPIIPWTNATGEDGKRYAHSWKWTGFEPTAEIVAFSRASRAENWEDFKAAIDEFGVGAQNFLYGDAAGNIGWYPSHLLPIRDNAETYPPYLPLPGTGEAEWIGYVPREELPQSYNPASGFLVTANADPRGYSFDGDPLNDGIYVGAFYDIGFRMARSHERVAELVARGDILPEEMSAVQADHKSSLGSRLRDPLVAVLNAAKVGADASVAGLWKPEMDAALTLLTEWDLMATNGVGAADGSPEATSAAAAAVFNVWLSFMVNYALDDEKGLLSVGDRSRAMLLLKMFEAPETMATWDATSQVSPIWNDQTTADVTETKGQIVLKALTATLAWLANPEVVGPKNSGGFGSADWNDWRWGALHTLTLPHNLVPTFAIPDPTVMPDGFPRHCDNFCVDASHPGMTDRKFTYSSGPAIRHVMELTSPVTRRGVLPGGQSERPTDPHYKDQALLYANNEAPVIPYLTADVLAKPGRTIMDFAP